MKFYSTNNKHKYVSLKEAVLKGLPDDNGLFMPESIPQVPCKIINNLDSFTFQEIAFEVSKNLLGDRVASQYFIFNTKFILAN